MCLVRHCAAAPTSLVLGCGMPSNKQILSRKLILEEKERGAMILLASHNKEDIQILADQVYRISAGVVSQSEERLQ